MITVLADSTIRDHTSKERMKIMHQEIIPIPVRPWTLNGISERMLVSHYENDYGGAVRALNAVRAELAALDAKAPGSRLRALKREELIAMGSVALHELYFGNLGGEGSKIPDNIRAILEEQFGSVAAWRREFVGAAQSLAGGSGWVLLTWSRRQRRLHNQIALDHSQAAVDSAPVLALDMYEHAYHLDFGANATAYIDAFMRNVDWTPVTERMAAVHAERAPPSDDPPVESRPPPPGVWRRPGGGGGGIVRADGGGRNRLSGRGRSPHEFRKRRRNRAVWPMPGREPRGPALLWRVRLPARHHVPVVSLCQRGPRTVLWRLRQNVGPTGTCRRAEVSVPRDVHPEASVRAHPVVEDGAGGRAQAGDRALRRSEELDGAARRA